MSTLSEKVKTLQRLFCYRIHQILVTCSSDLQQLQTYSSTIQPIKYCRSKDFITFRNDLASSNKIVLISYVIDIHFMLKSPHAVFLYPIQNRNYMPIMTDDNAGKLHFHLQRYDKKNIRLETKRNQETGLVD